MTEFEKLVEEHQKVEIAYNEIGFFLDEGATMASEHAKITAQAVRDELERVLKSGYHISTVGRIAIRDRIKELKTNQDD